MMAAPMRPAHTEASSTVKPESPHGESRADSYFDKEKEKGW